MKKLTVLIFMALSINSFAINKQEDKLIDTLKQYLTNLNLVQFSNKPIDSLIAKLPTNYLSLKVLGGSRIDIASYLIIKYPNGISIWIRVRNFTHFDPHNPNKLHPTLVWPVSLMRKETISTIRIFHEWDIINRFNE